MGLSDRLKRGWNAFVNNKDPTIEYRDIGTGYYRRPDRSAIVRRNERSIITTLFNRIAIDASSITIQHCRLDENGNAQEHFPLQPAEDDVLSHAPAARRALPHGHSEQGAGQQGGRQSRIAADDPEGG